MANRIPLVVGNWKMELSHKAEVALVRSLKTRLHDLDEGIEVVICPSFPSLVPIAQQLGRTRLQLGAQTVHWEERGAWTGEVSVTHIEGLVAWCIIGHSEQRNVTGQTDEEVQHAVSLLLTHGITPIVCLGETAAEREADEAVKKITYQMQSLLQKVTRASLAKLVIAYEPLWAIGTGVMPEPNDVAATMLLIRKLIAERFDPAGAERVRILYGGSVKAETIAPFLQEPGIDGVLVGGASIHPMEFVDIIQQVQRRIGGDAHAG